MTQKSDSEVIFFFTTAFKCHKNNDYIKAKDLYNKVLKISPNHFETIFLLGSLSVQTNE